MTPTRSGRNNIPSNGSGPGHSSHKSKRQECQPREAQMEDARACTTDITAIPGVRTESFPAGNNRDIPVSVQELVYGSKAAGVGTSSKSLNRHNELLSSSEEVNRPRKYRRTSEGLDTHVFQGTSPTDKAWLKNQIMLSEDQKKKLAQGKDNSPVEAPQAPTSKNTPQQVPNKDKQAPKSNKKGKGKEKYKWNKPYPQNYRISKKEKTAMDNVFNMARTLMEFKNKEEERLNQ
ncbi:hypothetical protein O181_122790 [Austropuccinia psidii MF-1]|uniref:Uncharacterized protein n=1 Tax=Austropuccinia psidii MF-1 TaxID=1389203 RepID=A0A9Q3KPY3_9BASI|nr:hypothetical protein [Austropuccinia psidii MF-1]